MIVTSQKLGEHAWRASARAAVCMAALWAFAMTVNLNRSDISGEARAIGSIRAVISGESSQTAFVSPDIKDDVRFGYRFEFFAGPKAEARETEKPSPSAMARYAYVAVPVKAGPLTARAYCGDDTGNIYVTHDGTKPAVVVGRCLDVSNPLNAPTRTARR